MYAIEFGDNGEEIHVKTDIKIADVDERDFLQTQEEIDDANKELEMLRNFTPEEWEEYKEFHK